MDQFLRGGVGFRFLFVECLLQKHLALAGSAELGLHLVRDVLFLFVDHVVELLDLRLQPHDFREFRPVLRQGVGVVRVQLAFLLQNVLDHRAFAHRRNRVVVPGLRQLIDRFLADAIRLRVGQFFFDLA